MNAVLALGITASGSCNSKINTHLKQVVDAEKLYNSFSSSLYVHEKAFYIHFAQGLVNLGKVRSIIVLPIIGSYLYVTYNYRWSVV